MGYEWDLPSCNGCYMAILFLLPLKWWIFPYNMVDLSHQLCKRLPEGTYHLVVTQMRGEVQGIKLITNQTTSVVHVLLCTLW